MLSHIPPWVAAVLGVLLVIGYRQSRPRELAPAVALAVAAAMAALSLAGVFSAFGAAPWPLASWAAGMAAAIWIGQRFFAPQGLRLQPGSGRVYVPGSWVPLALMLGIFAVKFGLGFAAGMGTPVPATSAAGAAVAAVLGLLSGTFAARAAAVGRVAAAARSVGSDAAVHPAAV